MSEESELIAYRSWRDVKKGDAVKLNPFLVVNNCNYGKYDATIDERINPSAKLLIPQEIFNFEGAKGEVVDIDARGYIQVEWDRKTNSSAIWWYLRDMLIVKGVDYVD